MPIYSFPSFLIRKKQMTCANYQQTGEVGNRSLSAKITTSGSTSFSDRDKLRRVYSALEYSYVLHTNKIKSEF